MIFVGGIHGVGKTTFCGEILEKLNIKHFSASKIISDMKKENFNNDKKIELIQINQDHLIQGLRNLNLNKEGYLLDGHFCLINKSGEIIKVPDTTFINLMPRAIVVVSDSLENISLRLMKRDGVKYEASFLELFQGLELEYSKKIANRLGIPYITVKPSEKEEIYSFINSVID
jgi:adenylate kinase